MVERSSKRLDRGFHGSFHFCRGAKVKRYRATVLPSAGLTHEVTQVLARGLYQVWLRESYSNGSRSPWGSGAVMNLAERPTLTVASSGTPGASLSWTAFDLASQYELWLENSSGTRVALSQSLVTSTLVTLSDLALPSDSYRVWVRALAV